MKAPGNGLLILIIKLVLMTNITSSRPWRILLLEVAYYATSSDRNFVKLRQNYARIPKLCSQNDVDSVHIGAQ